MSHSQQQLTLRSDTTPRPPHWEYIYNNLSYIGHVKKRCLWIWKLDLLHSLWHLNGTHTYTHTQAQILGHLWCPSASLPAWSSMCPPRYPACIFDGCLSPCMPLLAHSPNTLSKGGKLKHSSVIYCCHVPPRPTTYTHPHTHSYVTAQSSVLSICPLLCMVKLFFPWCRGHMVAHRYWCHRHKRQSHLGVELKMFLKGTVHKTIKNTYFSS